MHCNLRPLGPRQPFAALIRLRRHAKFDVAEPIHCRKYYSVFAANTLLYAVTFDLEHEPVA